MRRGTRRLIVKLTLCTLAGAVVTWGVAWGCALWASDQGVTGCDDGPLPLSLKLPPTLLGQHGFTVGRFRERHFVMLEERLTGGTFHVLQGDWEAFGWPVRSMRWIDLSEKWVNFKDRAEEPNPQTHRSKISVAMMGGTADRGFPLEVLPLGFALNTLLAAGVLLGVVQGFAFARRRVRRAKGRCPSCGYDRGGLAGGEAAACPECGAHGDVKSTNS